MWQNSPVCRRPVAVVQVQHGHKIESLGGILDFKQFYVQQFFHQQLKVIPQYCIAHPYCARFSRHQRAQIGAYTYTTKEISLKLSTIAKKMFVFF